MADWFDNFAKGNALPASVATNLRCRGFAVVPDFVPAQQITALSMAYDVAVEEASHDDLRVGSTTTRVQGLVGRLRGFDDLFLHPLLLEACACVIRKPFKLSSLSARTVHPEAATQSLHVDVKRNEKAWPLVGFIVMVDDFRTDNGATRLVPESQGWLTAPDDVMNDPAGDYETQVLACGPAGSVIIYHGSVWHGHSPNRTNQRRRSIQGAYIPRDAVAAINQAIRLRQDVVGQMNPLAAYVLAV
jgi:hypothetical protein